MLLLLLLFFVLTVIVWGFTNDRLSHIPGPVVARYSSLYKVLLVLDGNAPDRIRKLHEKYGRVVRVGPKDVYIADAKYIPAVYATRLPKTQLYEVFDVTWKGKRIQVPLSARSPAVHQPMRISLAQKLSVNAVKGLVPHVRVCINGFIEKISQKDGKPVDAYAWLQYWSYDTSAMCTFGSTFGLMDNEEDRDNLFNSIDNGFKYASCVGQVPGLDRIFMVLVTLLLLPRTRSLQLPDRPVELLKALEEKFNCHKAEHKVVQGTHVAHVLKESAERQSISFDEVMPELFTLVASNSTAIGTLLAVLYYLAHFPEHQVALYHEIQQYTSASGCKVEHLGAENFAQLEYLNAVIKESLRICPAAALQLERVSVDESMKVENVLIPSGTNVSICPNVIHRDSSVFGSECNTFDPRRWLGDNADELKEMERSLLSFGYGSRACGGKYFAMVEMGIFITSVLDRFEIQPDPSQSDWKLTHFWVPQAPGTRLIFRRREMQAAKE